MRPVTGPRRHAPATERNREPIASVLREVLPQHGTVLEIASGSGEHAAWFARGLPGARWRPSDPNAQARASIAARREAEGPANLLEPAALDAADPDGWPGEPFDAIVCINMIHIAPWAAAQGLMAGAQRRLAPGGLLYLYGPYREAGVPTAPSNEAFNGWLKAQDPAWGLRALEDVRALAAAHGLGFVERVAMPANNISVWFEKG